MFACGAEAAAVAAVLAVVAGPEVVERVSSTSRGVADVADVEALAGCDCSPALHTGHRLATGQACSCNLPNGAGVAVVLGRAGHDLAGLSEAGPPQPSDTGEHDHVTTDFPGREHVHSSPRSAMRNADFRLTSVSAATA